MKLVLKHNNEVKLFTHQLNFDSLSRFTSEQFQLISNTVSFTFKDDEGDSIIVLSNQDLEAMQAVFAGREYVKLSVSGTKTTEIKTEDLKMTQTQTQPQEEKKRQGFNKFSFPCQRRSKQKRSREGRCSGSKGQNRQHSWGAHKMEYFQKIDNFFNEKVIRLVDQRLKQLLPCLKQQIVKGEEQVKLELLSGIIHSGVECKGCLVNPIVGIRYQCPKCVNFNLCQKCQIKIDHEHNLLKIKNIEEEKNAEVQGGAQCPFSFPHFFGKLFKHHKHHDRHSSTSSSKSRSHQWKGHHHMKKLWGLAFLFGGEPQQYQSFVEENKDLKPTETYQKYAKLVNLSDEEFKQRFINMKCQKLSRTFGKPAEEYKAFVEENMDLGQREMMNVLYEKGIEKREDKKCSWGGRKFNFRNWGPFEEHRQDFSKKQQSATIYHKNGSKDSKRDKLRKQKQSQNFRERPKSFDKPQVARAKVNLLLKMGQIFGSENQVQYSKFIKKNYKLGEEDYVINLWADQLVHKSK